MECDICRTLAQQLRSYEMEAEDARDGMAPHGSGLTAGSLLAKALEESQKTRVLYQHHLERFHKPARLRQAIVSDSVTADMSGSLMPKADHLMHATPFWPDGLSGLTHQDVLICMAENRAWNKRLREGTAALVNTRLAKTITDEEYVSIRNRANHDAAECFRRASMLVRDLATRERGFVPFIDSSDLVNTGPVGSKPARVPRRPHGRY